jgi:protein-tyrosine-phosphatase
MFSCKVMMNEYGIDTSSHRSKLLSAEDVEQAYLIIPVKRDLGVYIKQAHPAAATKLKYLSKDVMDPWRQPYSVYLNCAHMVDSLVTEVLADITKHAEL